MMNLSVTTSPARQTRNRRTDVDRLCDALERQPDQQASKLRLREELGWDAAKLERVVLRALADQSSAVALVRRGKSIRYRGTERRGGSGGVGLYLDVERVIERYWGRDRHFRECTFTHTAVPAHRAGRRWFYPDLVLRCHPGRKMSPDQVKRVHTFEIETAAGFGIQSVYQAYEQGRGADFSWVLFHRLGSDRGRPEHPDWDRITRVARELGVGLVGFANSNSASTWYTYREPRARDVTIAERRAFDRNFPDVPQDPLSPDAPSSAAGSRITAEG